MFILTISADESFRLICFLVVKDLDAVDKLDPARTLSLACWDIFHVLSSADIFKVNYFKTVYQEHYESVKWFAARSRPTICHA